MELEWGRVSLGNGPNADRGSHKTLPIPTNRRRKTADDGLCVVTRAMAEPANYAQSHHSIGGGGGNRNRIETGPDAEPLLLSGNSGGSRGPQIPKGSAGRSKRLTRGKLGEAAALERIAAALRAGNLAGVSAADIEAAQRLLRTLC